MWVLIGVLILVTFIIILYFVIMIKLKKLSRKIFGTSDIGKVIQTGEFLDEETPKSLSSLDNLYLDQIKRDFPEMNINELKSLVETNIIECMDAIEEKNIKGLKTTNEKIRRYVLAKIRDLKDNHIEYKDIKFHKTVVSKYENKKGIATIYFGTAFEYFYKKNQGVFHKKQDRIITECIYVIDFEQVDSKIKSLGLNCPNCGAPIKALKYKKCSYCNSGVIDLVTRSFTINNMENR
ncbi:MAG: hypothetical protein HFJ12_05145 [Bacilli bacterium]|nr:hypothetical protein [Bacilli bacterium]